MQSYTPPMILASSFNCPLCGAFAHQKWYRGIGTSSKASLGTVYPERFQIAECSHCENHSFWLHEKMIYPTSGSAPLAHSDMPSDVKRDYEEARSIVGQSPRSAAALLRLAVQKLANDILGADRDSNLNDSIKKLVARGLPQLVQQALDMVRVIGNNAVHPGEIDLRDDITTATKLFELVNLIIDYMIEKPKQISNLYNTTLPEKEKDKIAKRDSRTSPV
jgi:hypothetical protein